jgi:flavin reductase (DIM6/NTAB) family NADH-FMN oxidoreductase RutF
MMKPLALAKVYRLLEPGPVVLLTTAQHGRTNVMAMSWHMMMDFAPPRVACVVSRSHHSFAALRATGECVIAVPGVDLAATVVQVGNTSGRDIDKFWTFGLTASRAQRVAAPLVAECFANLECRVADDAMVDRYNLFVLEVVQAWTDRTRKDRRTIHHHHHGLGTFVVDGETIKLKSKKP